MTRCRNVSKLELQAPVVRAIEVLLYVVLLGNYISYSFDLGGLGFVIVASG